MASKYQLNVNSFYYQNTNIPINKFEIKDSNEIQDLEETLIAEAYMIFTQKLNIDTIFDEKYFKDLHKKTLNNLTVQNLY